MAESQPKSEELSKNGRTIFQLINKLDGTRCPAILCTPREFVESCVKVFGTHVDLEGETLDKPDLSKLRDHLVLPIAAVNDGDNPLVDRRGISRHPLICLHRFAFMILNPDGLYDPNENFFS